MLQVDAGQGWAVYREKYHVCRCVRVRNMQTHTALMQYQPDLLPCMFRAVSTTAPGFVLLLTILAATPIRRGPPCCLRL